MTCRHRDHWSNPHQEGSARIGIVAGAGSARHEGSGIDISQGEAELCAGVRIGTVIRLEQLYPLPVSQLDQLYKKYNNATWFWIQEEPLNMGAASFLQMNLKSINYGFISRQPGASPATGYAKVHAQEQSEIIETAFSI